MELKPELKSLYKHWAKHTDRRKLNSTINLDQEVIKRIQSFVSERLEIYERKDRNEKRPYTQDKILDQYRFCNIYRELDKQTVYFHTLLKPLESDFELWLLNMLFCRSICSIETIQKIGLLNFDDEHNKKVFEHLLSLQSPKYGSAYIFPISIIQKSEWNTREKFFCKYFPKIINELSKEIKQFKNISAIEALKRILPIFKFNLKFIFTEVLIDIAYQYPQYIDLFKVFPIGPGSIPTMKMLNKSIEPEIVNLNLINHAHNIRLLTYESKPVHLSAENWEGIGCEFRKYTNLSNGNGRKRLY